MHATVFIALGAVISAGADASASDAAATVKKWTEAQKDVKAVHATFDRYVFDALFKSFEKTKGEVHYSSRTKGFWSVAPDSDKNSPPTLRRGNTTYVSKVARAERYIWDEDGVTIVNEDEKSYGRILQDAEFFGISFFPPFSSALPFLPGLPNKSVITEWDFVIVTETDEKVRLRATPLGAMKKHHGPCELSIKKPDLTLRAVRYTDSSGNHKSIYLFKTVNRSPEKMPDFDLSGYAHGRSTFSSSKR